MNKKNKHKNMNKFIVEILNILKKDKRLFSKDDNKLLKGELISLISKDDEKLLELLSSKKEIEKRFFKKVGKITIFQKENFLQLITMNEFLPDSFTAFEINIGLSNNKKLISSQEDISLVFPHKDCILEGGQDKEDVKREETFYNTILALDEIDRLKEPKVLTNWKKFDSKGEQKIKEISKNDNFVIKGNNLLALYSLLPNFRNKIKLIYIDPPYNTGNDDFKYNDSFNHSTWLTFIKNRLEVAKELLSDDGIIFVQCDDNEQAYLKVLMDEIFNRDKFVNCITVKMSESSGKKMAHTKLKLPKIKEYLLVYKKNSIQLNSIKTEKLNWDNEYNIYLENFSEKDKEIIDEIISKEFSNEEDVEKIDKILSKIKITGVDKKIKQEGLVSESEILGWKYQNSFRIIRTAASSSVKSLADKKRKINNNSFFSVLSTRDKIPYIVKADYSDSSKSPRVQVLFAEDYLSVGICDLWNDISTTGLEAEGGVKLKSGKKPEKLLQRIIEMTTLSERDIVLDFFAGSGTTCAVAHKMKRQYIGIEQMDYIHDLPEARLKNVIKGEQGGVSQDLNWKGGGSFVYAELLEWNHKYIRELESAKTKIDIKKIKAKIEKEAFYKYQIDTTKFDNQEFDKLTENEQKKVLIDVLDMNHLYVNLDSINDATFSVSKEDKGLNKKFYNQK